LLVLTEFKEKRFVMRHLNILLLVIVIALTGFMYMGWQQQSLMQTQLAELNDKNQNLADTLLASRDEIEFLNKKILEMERSSVKGLAKQANGAFLDGWESLMGVVGKEIERARKDLEAFNHKKPESPQKQAPRKTPAEPSST